MRTDGITIGFAFHINVIHNRNFGALKVIFANSTASLSAAGFSAHSETVRSLVTAERVLRPHFTGSASTLNRFFMTGNNHLSGELKFTGETT